MQIKREYVDLRNMNDSDDHIRSVNTDSEEVDLSRILLSNLSSWPSSWNVNLLTTKKQKLHQKVQRSTVYRLFNVKRLKIKHDHILDPYAGGNLTLSSIFKQSPLKDIHENVCSVLDDLRAIDYDDYSPENEGIITELIKHCSHWKQKASDEGFTAYGDFLEALADLAARWRTEGRAEEVFYEAVFKEFTKCSLKLFDLESEPRISGMKLTYTYHLYSAREQYELPVTCKPDLLLECMTHLPLEPDILAVVEVKPHHQPSPLEFNGLPLPSASSKSSHRNDFDDSNDPGTQKDMKASHEEDLAKLNLDADTESHSKPLGNLEEKQHEMLGWEIWKEVNADVCKQITDSEMHTLEFFLPQLIGELFFTFSKSAVHDLRPKWNMRNPGKAYRIGIVVLGLKVIFVNLVIVIPWIKRRPIVDDLLSLPIRKGSRPRTDIFLTRQYDLLKNHDRKIIAKVLLGLCSLRHDSIVV